MDTTTLLTEQIVKNIKQKINSSNTILIVCSKPIDEDSLGTALACRLWLEELGKKVTVINSFRLTENMKTFPDVNLISFEQENPDLNKYDLVITLDSRIWSQLFKSKDLVMKYNFDQLINIDHHTPADIAEDIPETTLRIPLSSTAEVFFTYFIESGKNLSPKLATYLYFALVGDTGNFKWAIGPNTLEFAKVLVSAGADLTLVDNFFKPSKEELQYNEWAQRNIENYPEIGVKLFLHTPEKDAEIEALLKTEYWEDHNKYFTQTFFDDLDLKFNYLITLKQDEDELKLSWRTRNNVPNTIEMAIAATKAGFSAGGHRNAGGGSVKISTKNDIEIIKQRLFENIRLEIEKILPKSNN